MKQTYTVIQADSQYQVGYYADGEWVMIWEYGTLAAALQKCSDLNKGRFL